MLRWDFKTDKIGTWTEKRTHQNGEEREYSFNLYSGNALLIACQEWVENGQEMYNVITFFCNTEHMKNCLGLTKGHDNIFNDKEITLTLYGDYKYSSKIASAFLKAKFDKDITIKILNDIPF